MFSGGVESCNCAWMKVINSRPNILIKTLSSAPFSQSEHLLLHFKSHMFNFCCLISVLLDLHVQQSLAKDITIESGYIKKNNVDISKL